jgi:hypothetical protein
VSADTAQGIYVPPASDTDGSSGAWVRKFAWPVNPSWWATAPGNTGAANYSAWTAMKAALVAMALVVAPTYQAIGWVRWDNEEFDYNATLEVDQGTMILEGTATGKEQSVGTILNFPTGVTGIRAQYLGTAGATGSGPVNSNPGARASIIRHLILKGAYTGTEAEAYGIQLRTACLIDNCVVLDFEGDGIRIFAGGADPTYYGNANLFVIRDTTCYRNRNGVYIFGDDAQAGSIEGVCDFSYNRQAPIIDQSSLGNFIRFHSFENGTIPGSTPCIVTNGGNWYGCKWGQEAGASTNAPSGTTADNTWWYYISAGGAVPALNIAAWVTATTYRAGGGPIASNANSSGMWSVCYTEDVGLAQIQAPARIDGGVLALRRNVGTAPRVHVDTSGTLTTTGPLRSYGNFSTDGAVHRIGPSDLTINTTATNNIVEIATTDTFGTLDFNSYLGGTPRDDGVIASWRNASGGMIVVGNPNVYFKSGTAVAGSTLVGNIDASGFNLETGMAYRVNGTQVVGARGAAVADATDAASAITQLNLLLARARAHGLIAP